MEEGLENEIAALKVLNHPNIVRLYHVEENVEMLYMVSNTKQATILPRFCSACKSCAVIR